MIIESFFSFISKIFFFTAYVNDKGSFPKPLTAEREKECILRFQENNDQEAKEILIKHNMRLVAYVAKYYYNANVEAEELLSAGNIGLIKGISTFKYGKGSKLATYAAKCINNEILMYLRVAKKHNNNVSLQEPIGTDKEGNEISRLDIIATNGESVADEVEIKIMFEHVCKDMLDVLDKRERQIIIMRFGLDGDAPLTQIEVADKLHICRSYVSRIEKKAIGKLREKLSK